MSAHTPGPWEVVQFAVNGPESIVGPRGENGRIMIAEVEPHTASHRHRLTKPGAAAHSNARLIAAAPNLLAALQAIAKRGPETQPIEREWNGMEDAYSAGSEMSDWELAEIARAAIAKAEV